MMVNKLNRLVLRICGLLLFMIMTVACGRDKVSSVEEYVKWFSHPDHGYVKEKRVGNILMRVQYRPAELMMVNELKSSVVKKDEHALDSLKNSYGESRYFLLEIVYDPQKGSGEANNMTGMDYNTYAGLVHKLSFAMQDAARLVCGGDTIAPSLYHYERGYELAKAQTLLFAFPATDKTGEKADMTFVYYDELFGTGIDNFNFKPKEQPQLAL